MSLRNKLIRLAHEKPELRGHLLPLLKEAGSYQNYRSKSKARPAADSHLHHSDHQMITKDHMGTRGKEK